MKVTFLLLALLFAYVHGSGPHHSFRLTYFDAKGRAEKIRLLFKAVGREEDLIDNRVDSSKWPALKERTRYGQLPVLRHGDFKLAQSVPIMGYVAQQLGLSSFDEQLRFRMLEIAHAVEDLRNAASPLKAAATRDDAALEALLKRYATLFEKNVEREDAEFLVGDLLSFADITFYDTFQQLVEDHLGKSDVANVLKHDFKAPKLGSIYHHVESRLNESKE